MSTVILIFVFVAIVHFVIEFVVAPHVRQEILFDAFVQRKRVREAHTTWGADLPAGQYQTVRRAVEAFPHVMFMMSFVTLFNFISRLSSDKEMRKRVEQRVRELEAIKHPDALAALKATSHNARRAVSINSAGWYLYLAPLALASRFVSYVRRTVSKVMTLPEPIIEKLSPDGEMVC